MDTTSLLIMSSIILIITIPLYSFILHLITKFFKYGEPDFLKAFQIVLISQVISTAISQIPTYLPFDSISQIIYAIGSFIINLVVLLMLINLIYKYSWKNTIIIFLVYFLITIFVGLIIGFIILMFSFSYGGFF
ncbi:MAG: hypothetical protein KC589_05835 [Nanoarchaeota archaeon]|nr:hypothetical protein [Nanoarchaeota archaeon]